MACVMRDYRPGDEEEVFLLVGSVLAEYGLKANPDATDADLRDIADSYLKNGGIFKILEDEGRIVGSYGLFPLSPTKCELRKMYLSREHRGKGLGKGMMEDALREAQALGFIEMTLETNTCLEEACALYRSFGFGEYTPGHQSDRCDCAMKKTL